MYYVSVFWFLLSLFLSLRLVIQEKVLAPTEDLQVSEERPEEP